MTPSRAERGRAGSEAWRDARNLGSIPSPVVCIGRLVDYKRVDVILEAVARVEATALEVIGDGPERERLCRRAQELSLGARVRFAGSLEHEAVLERLAAADLLMLASEAEGLPHVAVEALACGTPIASVHVGGVREVIVDRSSGLIVESRTPSAFAAVFRQLQDDTLLRRRLAASTRALAAEWRFERTSDEVESLLREVLNPGA
jgi:teichuronic acid biosynthesis glycosyltransferase TuaC